VTLAARARIPRSAWRWCAATCRSPAAAARLIPPDGLGLVRRAVFWSMLGWLPVVLWAWHVGRVLPGRRRRTASGALRHPRATAGRRSVADPRRRAGECADRALLPELVRSGIVPPSEVPAYRDVLAGVARLRDATLPWIVIVGVVLAVACVPEALHRAHEVEWAEGAAPGGQPGFGGLWYLLSGGRSSWRCCFPGFGGWCCSRCCAADRPTEPGDRADASGPQRRARLSRPVATPFARWCWRRQRAGLALGARRRLSRPGDAVGAH